MGEKVVHCVIHLCTMTRDFIESQFWFAVSLLMHYYMNNGEMKSDN